MTELEKQIKEKRMQLDSELPREGHEARFLRKLERGPARRIRFRHAIQVAASVAVILASAMVIIQQNRSGDKVAATELPESVREADHYYSLQVNQRYEEIRNFNFQSEEEKAVLLDELNDLDTYHQELMRDLEANPADERVINALIRHYQLKLEVMDQIIMQLEQFKTDIEPSHEKESA